MRRRACATLLPTKDETMDYPKQQTAEFDSLYYHSLAKSLRQLQCGKRMQESTRTRLSVRSFRSISFTSCTLAR